MTIRYAYYPGCAAESTAKEADLATRALCRRLGISLVDFDQFSCCGAGIVDEEDPLFAEAINARNLAIAEKQGLDILTLCNTCLLTMSTYLRRWGADQKALEQVNEVLSVTGLEYKMTNKVKHLLWVIEDDLGLERLASMVKRPLRGLRVAPFYGCHILRPPEIVNRQGQDSDDPRSLEKIIEILGAEPVDYPSRLDCCGFHILLADADTSLKMNARCLADATEEQADCMATPCTLCHISLDMYQKRAGRKAGMSFDMPVLHLSQLIGMALGMSSESLQLDRNIISPQKILQRC